MSTRTALRAFAIAFALLLIGALWRISQAQSLAPELPRAVPSATIPATTRTLRVAAGGNFQAALDSAKPGDAIELARGATFAGQFIVRGSGLVIRPGTGAALPSSGTRITPALAAALKLPAIRATTAGYAIATALGVHHVYLVGLDIGVDSSITQSYGVVGLGADRSAGQTTLASTAHDLVLSQVYVHGRPELPLRRCIALNSGATAIVDSWISDCHDAGTDAQGILGWNGPGPYLIRNNEIQGSSQAIMFGGVDAASADLSPADVTIQRNHFFKPDAWKNSPWLIKCVMELKNGKRILIEGNVGDGNWPQAWDGSGFTFKSVNQDGSAPWSGTTDLTVRLNLIRHTGGGMNLHSNPESNPDIPMARVAIVDNIILGLNSPEYSGSGKAFYLGGHIDDLRIEHNTVTWVGPGRGVEYEGAPPQPFQRTRLANNLFATVGGIGLLGQTLGYPGPVLAAWAPGGTITGNVFAVGLAYSCCQDPSRNWDTYPPGNRMLINDDPTFASLKFAPDWSLSAASPLKGAGSDGRDPGADVAAVLSAIAGVVDGIPVSPALPPLPMITAAQLRAAVAAMDKVVSAAGRENAATKAALAPAAVYLHALLGATP